MRKLSFIFIFALTFVVMGYLYFLVQGAKEKQFLSDLETKINSKTATVMISEIVNSAWDNVCVVDTETTTEDAHKIDVTQANFYYALVFIHKKKVIDTLKFKPDHVTINGLEMPRINFNGQFYRFISKYGKNCLPRNQAALKAETIDTGCCGASNEITFSSSKGL